MSSHKRSPIVSLCRFFYDAQWQLNQQPMLASILWYLDPLSSHQLKRNIVEAGTPLAKFAGSA